MTELKDWELSREEVHKAYWDNKQSTMAATTEATKKALSYLLNDFCTEHQSTLPLVRWRRHQCFECRLNIRNWINEKEG